MDWQAQLDAARAVADPAERARVLTDLLAAHREVGNSISALRRDAIDAALATGMPIEHLARATGVTSTRIRQMIHRSPDLTAEPEPPTVTGWRSGRRDEPEAAIAITGSRSAGTSAEHIGAAVPALADLLMRRAYSVSHGPVGVGAEVMTLIADQHHPEGLSEVRGIIGHPNVVRDAEYVLIVGGGKGTQTEADLALSGGKRVLPMPASGGTAAQVYQRMLTDPQLRGWLLDSTFLALATAGGDEFARIAETAITTEARS